LWSISTTRQQLPNVVGDLLSNRRIVVRHHSYHVAKLRVNMKLRADAHESTSVTNTVLSVNSFLCKAVGILSPNRILRILRGINLASQS
jgi:hypothetical protein